MSEEILNVVTAYESGARGSLVVAIPKLLRKRGFNPGQRFLVKLDEKGRVIYEPLARVKSK